MARAVAVIGRSHSRIIDARDTFDSGVVQGRGFHCACLDPSSTGLVEWSGREIFRKASDVINKKKFFHERQV